MSQCWIRRCETSHMPTPFIHHFAVFVPFSLFTVPSSDFRHVSRVPQVCKAGPVLSAAHYTSRSLLTAEDLFSPSFYFFFNFRRTRVYLQIEKFLCFSSLLLHFL